MLTLAGLGLVYVSPLVLDTYTVNVLTRSLLYAMLALTLDVLWGYTGILSYGQSAFFAIGAYALGLSSTHLGFMASPPRRFFGVLVAAAAAALTGWLGFGRGVTPLYVSIVTLALPIVVKQGLLSGGLFTGSSSGLSGFDSFDLEVENWFRIGGVALVLLTASAWRFVKSDAGSVLVAIRENELRCRYLGIPTASVKIGLMVVSALIAAAAGYAYAGYTVVVSPELAGFEFGTQILIWVALGGRGTLIGPVIGALVIDLGSAYLSGSIPYVWELAVGLAFVLVIVVMPARLHASVRRPRSVDRARRARPPEKPRRKRRRCLRRPAPFARREGRRPVGRSPRSLSPLRQPPRPRRRQLHGAAGGTGQPRRSERRRQDDADPLHRRRRRADER